MKTLHELLKDHAGLLSNAQETQQKLAELRNQLVQVVEDIHQNFAPRDLIGLECLIDVRSWREQDNRSSYDLLMNDNTMLVEHYGSGYRKEMKGRKCKIVDVQLAAINNDGSIPWVILAKAAKANGEYGAFIIRTTIVDKSHLTD